MAQQRAIARFVAKKVGLAGNSDLEQARADMIVDYCADFIEQLTKCFKAKTDEEKQKNGEALFKGGMQTFNTQMGNILKQRGGKFFSGGQLTWADLFVAHILNKLMSKQHFLDIPHQEIRFQGFELDENLNDLWKRVNEIPQIKKWIEKRPKGDADY